MKSIYYNSWLTGYKKPFGAVPIDETVTFTIVCEGMVVESVFLIVQKDFGATFEVKMHTMSSNHYQESFQLSEEQGLYYYYFKVIYQEEHQLKTIYYGNNQRSRGGEGQTYEEKKN